METILIECPHCNEKMQVPKDRESVICMFCGKTVPVSEILKNMQEENGQLLDEVKCQENLNFVLQGAGGIFREYEKRVRTFKKDTYLKLFESYKEENYAYYTALKICLMNLTMEKTNSVYDQIADTLIAHNEKMLSEVSKKNDKFAIQMDMNMFMAIFVMPAMREIHLDQANLLTERIASKWSEAFKESKIQPSDFDDIMKGFHRKLCYVTTAVCDNMHKEPECEELRLIKNFRDTYLLNSENGSELIKEYYDIAPTLVKKIQKSNQADLIYNSLWESYIKPCVEYIKKGKNESCKTVYCNMVNTLRTEYMEEHHE